MRPYETMVVLSNELGENKKALVDRLEQVIRNNGGNVDATHDWGNRKMAYTISRQHDAHYYLFEYQAEPGAVAELERTLRISDGVLRYMSIQQDHTGLPPVRQREYGHREHVPLYELRGPRGHSGGGRDSTADAAANERQPEGRDADAQGGGEETE
jgi:small subunit ribosomal protein S6